MSSNRNSEYFMRKINKIQEMLKCSYETACITAYLDSIGYRIFEIKELIEKEKGQKKER